MENTKKKRHHIFIKIVAVLLIFSLLGFYAFSFPKTMELIDKKANEIIRFFGGDFEISLFSDFSVFMKKAVNNVQYYYEIIKENLKTERC